jgi:hypothetical protein
VPGSVQELHRSGPVRTTKSARSVASKRASTSASATASTTVASA